MASDKLKKINNEIKDYINESNFISIKTRNKIIKMLGDEFDIKFKLDNYQTIDVTILENGHIIMYGDEYTPEKNIEGIKEIEERYNNFKVKADNFLNKKEVSFNNKKIGSNILNLFVILIILLIFIGLLSLAITSFIRGHYINCIWIIFYVLVFFNNQVSDN